MGRRRRNGDSSLELLLDTICNTFGGVLFLAILVSLLLKTARHRSPEAPASAATPRPAITKAQLIRTSTEASELRERLERLEGGLAAVRRFVNQFSTPEFAVSLERLHAEQRRRNELEAEKVAALEVLAADQTARATAAAAKAESEKRVQQAAESSEKEAARLEQARRRAAELAESAILLQEDVEKRQVIESTGKAPRERETNKREFGVMLRYGRVYLMHVRSGESRSVNTRDFMVEKGLLSNTAKARPGAGIDIVLPDSDVQLQSVLADYPPDLWYPCLVVHPDSFDTFQLLKSRLVARGYEYRLLVTDNPVTDRGPATGKVQ